MSVLFFKINTGLLVENIYKQIIFSLNPLL